MRITKILCSVLVLGTLALALSTAAAQQERQQSQRRALQVQPASDVRLPASLQRQLEADVARRANPNCGSNCVPEPGSRLLAPGKGGGGELDYVCNHGSCACAGACDCAVMGTICAPDTIGCSDYGCTCAEADGAEHPEQGSCD